jgi:hypothetical protein
MNLVAPAGDEMAVNGQDFKASGQPGWGQYLSEVLAAS